MTKKEIKEIVRGTGLKKIRRGLLEVTAHVRDLRQGNAGEDFAQRMLDITTYFDQLKADAEEIDDKIQAKHNAFLGIDKPNPVPTVEPVKGKKGKKK